jgi:putative addiction module killer protein
LRETGRPINMPTVVDTISTTAHISSVVEVVRSATFDVWLSGLKDARGRARVLVRIDRLARGNPGDVRPVGGGISEMRIDFGPGYRVYFMQRSSLLIILRAGGDKSTQSRDILAAKNVAALWKD